MIQYRLDELKRDRVAKNCSLFFQKISLAYSRARRLSLCTDPCIRVGWSREAINQTITTVYYNYIHTKRTHQDK